MLSLKHIDNTLSIYIYIYRSLQYPGYTNTMLVNYVYCSSPITNKYYYMGTITALNVLRTRSRIAPSQLFSAVLSTDLHLIGNICAYIRYKFSWKTHALRSSYYGSVHLCWWDVYIAPWRKFEASLPRRLMLLKKVKGADISRVAFVVQSPSFQSFYIMVNKSMVNNTQLCFASFSFLAKKYLSNILPYL